MQHVGTLRISGDRAVSVYVCDAVVTPSDQHGGLERELVERASRAAGDPAVVLTAAELDRLLAERAEAEAKYARACERAEAANRRAPAPLTSPAFEADDDSDLIDEDPPKDVEVFTVPPLPVSSELPADPLEAAGLWADEYVPAEPASAGDDDGAGKPWQLESAD